MILVTIYMRIIFMGSPSYAAHVLEDLYNSDCNHTIVATYTKPPKPTGRGMKVKNTPVHEMSNKYKIPVFHPKSLRPPEEQEKFLQQQKQEFKADIIVVVAYGCIIPDSIIKSTKHKAINIHPSLLPRWRGHAPVRAALLSGDITSGVCIIDVTKKLDAGAIYNSKEITISPDLSPENTQAILADCNNNNFDKLTLFCQIKALHDSLDNLTNHLFSIGSILLLKTLYQIENNIQTPTPQSTTNITSTLDEPMKSLLSSKHILMPSKDTNQISSEIPEGYTPIYLDEIDAMTLYNYICALSPSPGIFVKIEHLLPFFPKKHEGQLIKLLRTETFEHFVTRHGNKVPAAAPNNAIFCKGPSVLKIMMLQLQGKKPLSITDFFNGMSVKIQDKLQTPFLCGNLQPASTEEDNESPSLIKKDSPN